METLHEKLIDIQQRLKVPKDKTNDFGGFKYRNLESIEEEVKPLLKEHELVLTLSDEVISVGDRVFVKATASLSDGETIMELSANAQHAQSKKGMDEAQLTGACSSYARKYALGGLFLIDDTRDADSMDNASSSPKTPQNDAVAKAKQKVHAAFTKNGVDDAGEMRVILVDVLGKATIDSVEDADKVIERLEK